MESGTRVRSGNGCINLDRAVVALDAIERLTVDDLSGQSVIEEILHRIADLKSADLERRAMTEAEQDVLSVLQALLEAMAARDTAGMRALCSPTGWAAHSREGRIFHERLWDLPDRLPQGAMSVEERIFDPVVRVDEDIAMIWCAYDVYIDGEPHHWGTNIVSLMQDHGTWLVSGVTDNGRSGARP